MTARTTIGKRIALVSIAVCAGLSIVKIVVGLLAGSTSVVADGVESAGDVLASGFVLIGFIVAAKPADKDHPYGHGRYETITGLIVGLVLVFAGIAISMRSLENIGKPHAVPALYGIWPLLASMILKIVLATTKFRFGRRIGSSALLADAWNDTVDILSAMTAMIALTLTVHDPTRFQGADHYGGFAIGLIVVVTGLRVAKDSSDSLADTMPPSAMLEEIRRVATSNPRIRAVEKCYARKTGMQYHVDLHIEVDPEMSVLESHEIATDVRFAIREQLEWVADVLVHVEPWAGLKGSLPGTAHEQGG
jgi:cation diffusion facilitator family transporter